MTTELKAYAFVQRLPVGLDGAEVQSDLCLVTHLHDSFQRGAPEEGAT